MRGRVWIWRRRGGARRWERKRRMGRRGESHGHVRVAIHRISLHHHVLKWKIHGRSGCKVVRNVVVVGTRKKKVGSVLEGGTREKREKKKRKKRCYRDNKPRKGEEDVRGFKGTLQSWEIVRIPRSYNRGVGL